MDMSLHKLIYLHGFNSASVDEKGLLLPGKTKLQLLSKLCEDREYQMFTPNLDYQNKLGDIEKLNELAE